MANLTFLFKMTKVQNSQKKKGHEKLLLIARHASILFKPHFLKQLE